MALPPSIELLLRQGQRNVQRINQRSSAIGQALQPYAGQVSSMYGGMQSREQAVGGAVANSQTQLGSQLGGQITSALQGINAPAAAISQYGGGTATTGAQAGQAIGGLSSAELGRLRGEGSAEAIYAAALPRLAALAGDAERRGYLSELATEMSDLALRESQSQMERELDDRKWRYQVAQDQRALRRQNRLDRYKIKQDSIQRKRQAKLDKLAQRAAAQEYGLDVAKEARYQSQAAETARHHRQTEALAVRKQGESEAQFHERERRYRQQFEARMRAARKKGYQPNSALSAKYGYIVDSHGKPILTPNGKKIPVRTDKKTAKAPWEK